MSLPVRYTDILTQEGLGFTIVLERPVSETVFKQIKDLIDSWYEVGFYGGYGGTGFHDSGDIEYDEDDLWVSWTVDMGDVGTEAVDVLAKILDGFSRGSIGESSPGFKELVVGHIVEK